MIVHGYIEGVYYAVTVGALRPEAAATVGVVSGARHAVLLLEMHNGRELPRSGTILDVNDPDSVLTALQELTEGVRTEDLPPSS
ncbi:hypothetical protein GCM10022252_75490 [Streptosporangium oxazolinicum]|uniref:Uncharacterized protein n=1 Tax=Streptosporangium oxazolinicum TaxID=909287 RepID=A0ABP8BLB8_9ACTN